jgi:GNAT superfamily N-acetyltransferase
MNIEFSTPTVDELKFILDSWSSSYRKSKYAGTVPNNHWEEISRATATQLMSRPRCRTIVALAPSDTISLDTGEAARGRVMGYSVAEPGILHWIYTKKDFRRLGIATQMLNEQMTQWDDKDKKYPRFTHRTDASYRFLPRWWKWDTIPARVK